MTMGVQPAQRAGQGIQIRVVTMQGRDHHRLRPPLGTGQGVADRGRQHRMRRQLHKHPLPLGEQMRDRVEETDRLPQIGEPIPGIHHGGIQRLLGHRTSHRGIQRHLRRLRDEPSQLADQLLTQLLHLG
ncbi:hypothetical protein MSIMFI_05392 [Mycobacterium simulans]|nr:hypothetical protein MSIMFI_05392 [Mycobacterium simulans]